MLATALLPISLVLNKQHSTAYFNFMTLNKAYSLAPRPTFIDRKSMYLQELRSNRTLELAKINERGIQDQPILWPEEEDGVRDCWLDRETGSGRVGDSSTWTIPLSPIGSSQNHVDDSVIEHSKFEICKKKAGRTYLARDTVPFYEIRTEELSSSVLRHRYTAGPITRSTKVDNVSHQF